jgi:hypothetical protein
MQITMNRRRLTVAAAFVVAVIAAPLAVAAVAGKGASSPTLVRAASPAALRSAPGAIYSPDTTRSTGDNPYQLVKSQTFTANQFECVIPGFQGGVNFAIDEVSVFADSEIGMTMQGAWLRVWTKLGPNLQTDSVFTDVPLTLDSGGKHAFRSDGVRIVAKPNPFALAAVGDIYELYLCVQNGATVGRVIAVFTGQKTPPGTPTAASIRDFTARPQAKGATLRWTTGSESSLLGFNVWRFRNGKGVKVNRTLIRAKRSGEPAGASYSFVDAKPGARRGLSYRLQLVDVQGKRTWYAAFAIPA